MKRTDWRRTVAPSALQQPTLVRQGVDSLGVLVPKGFVVTADHQVAYAWMPS
jgi:hypothetical protein